MGFTKLVIDNENRQAKNIKNWRIHLCRTCTCMLIINK